MSKMKDAAIDEQNAISLLEKLGRKKGSLTLTQQRLIHNIYEQWLMDNYPEDCGCKDQHIELVENRTHWETFIEAIQEEV